MVFFNKKKEHPNTVAYKKMLKQRDSFKESIMKNLFRMGFSEEEVIEVFLIIDKYSNQMEAAKKPLINITPNDILNKVEDEVKKRTAEISENMLKELKEKVDEIKMRKNND